MNTLLKSIETSFPLKNHPLLQPRKLPRRKRTTLISCCKSSSSSSDEENKESRSDGDIQKQEILAKIAMLQAQKVRLTDFLDERSAYLTQFAQDANAEFDEIGETAFKGLDDAEARILENIENRMQVFEENAELSRNDIERNEQNLSEFEDKMEKDQNEGLFFKSPRKQKRSSDGAYAPKEEMQKLRQVDRENAGSRTRRSIYLALICLLAVTILDALITSPMVEWRKIAALGLILVALTAQLVYEQRMSTAGENKVEEKNKE